MRPGEPAAVFLLLGLMATMPWAVATPPGYLQYFWVELDADPLTERTATLTGHGRVFWGEEVQEPAIRLEVPDWLVVEPAEPWLISGSEGSNVSHEWRVTPTREGYWYASLNASWGEWECCLFARSEETSGAWRSGLEWEVVPPANVEGEVSLQVLDGEHVEFTYTVTAVPPWPKATRLVVKSDDGRELSTGDGDEPVAASVLLDLPASGGRASVMLVPSIHIEFEGAHSSMPRDLELEEARLWAEVTRKGDRLEARGPDGDILFPRPAGDSEQDDTLPLKGPEQEADGRGRLPAAGVGLFAAGVALALAAIRRVLGRQRR